MTSYDPYDREYSRRYVREERREERDPRFLDARDYSRNLSSRDLVPRAREDSDLSVEEIRREFPPPQGRDIRRARSAGPGSYYDDDDYDDYYDRRSSRKGGSSVYHEETERKSKHKTISKQEQIIAAVAGAALLVGGKEMYDRREAKSDHRGEVKRNALASAALAGVGALAAYQGAEFYNKQQAKKDQKATYILHRGRDGNIHEYYSDEDEDPKEKKSNKNFLESALAATGLGAAVKSFTGGGDKDDRSDTRSRRGGSRDSSPSRIRGANKMQKAAMASLLAGATEAFRVSKEPGGWKGEKTRRILTAAAGAATVDAAQDKDHGKLGLAESVIGGLVGNRLINGSKNDIEEDKKTGRSRSRSRARSKDGGSGGSGLAALATAGLGAFGAKKAYDSYQSRSRSRAGSQDSRGRGYDSRDGSPDRRRRSRSRSVVDKARNSLAKLGIGSGAGALAASDDDRRRTQDNFDDRGSRRSRRYSDDMYDDDYRSNRDRDYDDDRSHRGGGRDRSRRRGGRSDYGSDTDLGDSSEDEKRARKMKGKQLLTTGLAAVATIHAAHGVYQSMEKRNARQKAVREGRLSPAEAKKLKTKAMVQDVASVGIAALGVKGAIDEMKEAKHIGHECKEFKSEKARRHERREERRKRLSQSIGGRRRADSWSTANRRPYDSDDDDYYEPQYFDGNPYRSNTLPAPPMGASYR
jgi:hypothetical protein